MKLLLENRKARFDYHLEKPLEVGLILKGWQVKSLLEKSGDIVGSYVKISGNEVYLTGLNIIPLANQNMEMCNKNENIKVLMKKSEIAKISGKIKEKGFTLVVTKIYYKTENNCRKIKASLCLARGKNVRDKRETVKQRDIERQLKRNDY